ncbi:hypothetical protein AB4212_57115, partial [Streptomyces sp. 2MCAF27]
MNRSDLPGDTPPSAATAPGRDTDRPPSVGGRRRVSRHSLLGAVLAGVACCLVGASFTANSVLGHYPHAGGQALRYGLACVLLLPLAGRGGQAVVRPLRALSGR